MGKRQQQQQQSGSSEISPNTTPKYKIVVPNSAVKPGDQSITGKEAATIQGSFIDNEGENKCLQCVSSTPQKSHTLDCTHSLCMNCAREQLENQLRTKVGNIIFYCKTCKAPKNLSILSSIDNNLKIETVWLACECVVDVLQLDKSIRTASSPDKIIRFDLKDGKIKYPLCLKGHTMTHEDLIIMYGKRAQKLDLYRAQLKSETLISLIDELNKQKNIVDVVLDQANLRKCNTESVMRFIKELKFIKSISLRCAKIDRPALEGIYAGLKGNQKLHVFDLFSTNLTSENITNLSNALSTSFSIQTLDLSGNNLDKESIKSLCNGFLKKTRTLSSILLESIGIDENSMKELCETLIQIESLKKVSFANNLLQPDHSLELSNLLAKSETLEHINISGTFPNEESCGSFGKGLLQNKKLNTLIMEANTIESHELALIMEPLGKHKCLKVLSLADSGLDEACGALIGSFITASRTIEEINLKCNYLYAAGIEAIMNGLKSNVGMRILNIRKNKIGKEGANFIASYLKGSPSFLEDLEASCNSIEDAGGIEIMNGLKENKSLKKLILGDNALGDEFAVAVSQLFKVNTTLEFLSLESNGITNKGAQAIADTLPQAKGIHTLNIENNVYTQFGALAVLRAKQQNVRVKVITSEVTHFVTSLG